MNRPVSPKLLERQPEESDAASEKPRVRTMDRPIAVSPESATLYDVRKRLRDVEQKLDTILEILKPTKP